MNVARRLYSTGGPLPPTIKSLFQISSSPSLRPNTISSIQGWIKSVRLLKKIAFIDLQDGTTNEPLKIIVKRTTEQDQLLKQLSTGQGIAISDATWRDTPTRDQKFELVVDQPNGISLLGNVQDSYPLQKKYHTLPFLRSLPTLKHRTSYLGSLLRFRSFVEDELANFFRKNHVSKVAPPILTSGDCEGAGELFRVESNSNVSEGKKNHYFGKPTFLTVSTQLHLEVLALALTRCWTLSPCFRAEESDTNRHLSEFWMLESELCFVEDVHQLTQFTEDMLKSVISACLQNQNQLLQAITPEDGADSPEIVASRWQTLLSKKWPNVTYTEAIDILKIQDQKLPFKFTPTWGEALQTEHEKWLAGEYYNSPVFVTDYPRDCKAFYMKQSSDGKTVACFDLLVPQMGEIVGGSIREDNYDTLLQEMKRRGMNFKELEWYTDLRRNGSVPHGGFGLGLERLVSYLYGSRNIRDAIPFYRSATGVIDL